MVLPQLRRTLRTSIRVSVILLSSLLLLESLLIVLDPYLFRSRFEYDPDMGFRGRAYFPSPFGRTGDGEDGTLTNQFGFNDRDYPLQKSGGTQRILFVGDSFGWAGGLDGNYTARLERMFEQRDGGHKVDVINAGYSGTHTGEQLVMLKKFGLQYHPDLVILGFFAGNDFLDADPNRKLIVLNGCPVNIDKRHEHRLFGYPMVANLRTLVLLKERYQLYREASTARREGEAWAKTTGQPVPFGNLSETNFWHAQQLRLRFFNRKTSAQEFAANIKYIFDSLSEMDQLLKTSGIKFMVAIFPDELQVNRQLFDAVTTKFNLTREDYDLDLPQNLLKSFLTAKDISFLDMSDRFRDAEAQHDLYGWRTTHWNNAGNSLAAELLFQYLVNQPYEFNRR